MAGAPDKVAQAVAMMRESGDPLLRVFADAFSICQQRASDYNDLTAPTGITRDMYFPLGLPSYAQMLHVKSTRLLSLAAVKRGTKGESVKDTALDMINYAAFLAERIDRNDGSI